MKFTIAVISIVVSFCSYADCIGRMVPADEHRLRLFKLESCLLASEYIKTKGISPNLFSDVKSNDLAVEISHANEFAAKYMRKEREFWHYKGNCSNLPLHKTVIIETTEHCSDTGLTLYQLLGDVTIDKIQVQK